MLYKIRMTTSLLTLPCIASKPTLRLVEETRTNRLKEVRDKRGMSQYDLAAAMDVAQQQVFRWEKGDLKFSTARQLAKVLRCAEQDLFGTPEFPSIEGWTAEPPAQPLPDMNLLAGIVSRVEVFLEEENLALSPEKRASLISSLYQLAADQAADRGIPPSQADLRRYDNVIRLQV